MPNHRTHLSIGLAVYAFTLYLVLFLGPMSWQRGLELLMYTLIGSLFPDIDTKSKIQRIIYTLFFILLMVLAYTRQYMAATAAGICACVPLMVHHRGIFHSMIFLTFLAAGAIFSTYLYFPAYTPCMVGNALFFLAGVYSHLVADKKRFL